MSDIEAMGRNQRLMTRFVEILNSDDVAGLREVMHEDFIQDIPQSGERVRGLENYLAILTNYPGRRETPFQSEYVRVIGEEPHYVMTPTFHLVRLQGHGDNPVGIFRLRYPDNSLWWMLALYTVRDDKLAREVDFFAPEFPAPPWRAQWVERLDALDIHAP